MAFGFKQDVIVRERGWVVSAKGEGWVCSADTYRVLFFSCFWLDRTPAPLSPRLHARRARVKTSSSVWPARPLRRRSKGICATKSSKSNCRRVRHRQGGRAHSGGSKGSGAPSHVSGVRSSPRLLLLMLVFAPVSQRAFAPLFVCWTVRERCDLSMSRASGYGPS